MKYLFPLLVILLLSCSTNTQEKPGEPEAERLDTVGVKQPSTASPPPATEEKPKQIYTTPNSIFIDQASLFTGTNEIYVSMYFNPGNDINSLEEIKGLLTEKIEDESSFEIARTKLPLGAARNYFNMTNMDSLRLFSRTGKDLGMAYLKRAEFLQGPIEDEYIAVYEPDRVPEEESMIAISGNTLDFAAIEVKENKDVGSTMPVLKAIEIHPGNHRFTLSANTNDRGAISRLIQEQDTLLHVDEVYVIFDFYPTPLIHNNQPIMLLMCGMPGTDFTWQFPAVFNGERYVVNQSPWVNVK